MNTLHASVFLLSLAEPTSTSTGAPTDASGSVSVDSSGASKRGKWSSKHGDFRLKLQHNTVEVGPYIGVFIPAVAHELYEESFASHSPFQRAAFTFGLRAAYMPLNFLGAELEGGMAPTKTREDDYVSVFHSRLHGIAQLPLWRIVPFVLGGGGIMGVASKNSALGTDVDRAFHWGAGLKYYPKDWLAVRVDFRQLFSARRVEGFASHFEVLAGVSFVLGRCAPKGPKDSDGDGFMDDVDACPTTPGIAPDGCPPADRDKDGFLDIDDKCPDEPGVAPDGCPVPDRDKDGFTDDVDKCPDDPGVAPDGCPLDSDKDGVYDRDDKCPQEPGVKPDGCPPDSDGDGIRDPQDKCPQEPEVKNHYEDEDGCPDEIPKQIQPFTGVIEGITFDVDKATIRPSSRKILNAAVKVLKEHPELKVDIAGHTDNTGPRDHNVELSAARADAVKKFLVDKGIEQDRITTRGAGPDEPIADNDTTEGRSKNRRTEFKTKGALTAKPAKAKLGVKAKGGANVKP